MVVENLSQQLGGHFRKNLRLKGSLAIGEFAGEKLLVVKPSTFMNNSGVCANRVIDKYNVEGKDCLVVYDDVDLPLGVIRFREKGSSGGHRGIASVLDNLGIDRINRLRIGISRPTSARDVSGHVLSNFCSDEKSDLTEVISRAVSACKDWIKFGSSFVMKNYNKRGV